jgi:DNA-binding transcriptional LysR family regulator
MYTPQSRPGFTVEQLFEDELVLVTTDDSGGVSPGSYIQVEWGPEFLSRNRLTQPQFSNPAIIAGVGWLGLHHMLATGGSTYLPERLARPYLQSGRLYRAIDSQVFKLPAYMVYPIDHDRKLFDAAKSAIYQAIAEIDFSSRTI